jgi:hypothetical protein
MDRPMTSVWEEFTFHPVKNALCQYRVCATSLRNHHTGSVNKALSHCSFNCRVCAELSETAENTDCEIESVSICTFICREVVLRATKSRTFCTRIICIVISSKGSGHRWEIILKCISKKYGAQLWTGFVWFRIWTGGGLMNTLTNLPGGGDCWECFE